MYYLSNVAWWTKMELFGCSLYSKKTRFGVGKQGLDLGILELGIFIALEPGTTTYLLLENRYL